ncbi:UDP-N-acetylmuramate dehydrogenase [Flavihumibacter sp. CACIAM 22H1]|uniref:UDP-N-acetylmuramate dehydrogenase n=1 Tax=Flavihumibacter sp. CACIAM 22H1 TaxID=1812911 RepID=UPI0007A85600|nr:UDP-N-acetylmuramate dehydrogenase [Flavihumibacter sp. CACIAM 22H1]KYP14020.1 MAG: UDP-N-acetylenolpyruvoylglucosamine reductase [Flavihumibacter sp. CACIAM 22H1]
MEILENCSLKTFTSFGISATARYLASFEDTESLEEILYAVQQSSLKEQSTLVLGGGSNILFTQNWNGWVLKNEIAGITLQHEDPEYIYVKAGAGENWHQFTQYCIEQGWAGLENLSLIPGNVGASPMQNIGAYGVELRDVFWDLEAYHKQDKQVQTFTSTDCAFGYRESVFKNRYRDQFIILSVTFRLRKQPIFHIQYGAIREELEKMGVQDLSIRQVAQAVMNIRRSKLPDPAQIGNAGSFFKNPVVPREKFQVLKQHFPEIVGHAVDENSVKLAAGWLIESCGWKGYRKGDAGCHEKQALVLVNYGNASGKEIYDLSQEILESVLFKFGVQLEREVNII